MVATQQAQQYLCDVLVVIVHRALVCVRAFVKHVASVEIVEVDKFTQIGTNRWCCRMRHKRRAIRNRFNWTLKYNLKKLVHEFIDNDLVADQKR